MRVIFAHTLAVAAIAAHHAAAFVVPSGISSGKALARPCSRVSAAAPLRMGLSEWVPGSVKGLFGKSKAQAGRARDEGAALFRQLGVAADASFEEIQEATARLKSKYAGDRKQQVRIDKLKDDIMDLRLRQRMSKTAPVSSGVMAAQEAERYLANRKKGPLVPTWTRGWIKLPDKAWAAEALYPFTLFGVFGVIFPSGSKLLIAVSALFCAARMSQRDAPPMEKNDLGQYGAIPPPSRATVVATLFVTVTAGVLGVPLGALLCRTFGQSILVAESWTIAGMQILFALSALFFSTFRKK
eukprot:TRINITY_DN17576_c0_g1_i1.p1 TRINITY_DN17576_c0_g1~~TRINITY_DN17576_c0_g1_i1.p1  ORF type:complete len:345 (-),score=104.16 TRINITY_DN17576_c0_g1_i1:24-917(-)